MALFPLIELPSLPNEGGGQMPLFREAAWDFKTNTPIWRGGEPVYITGAPAVLVWCWNTLHAQRGVHDVFTRDHGLGIRELTGRACTPEIERSEAVRYVKEALLVNPYVTAVEAVEVDFTDSRLTVSCRIQTVYGEVTVDGCKL